MSNRLTLVGLIIFATTLTLINCRLCTKQSSIQINLWEYKIPKTNTYKFAFDIHSDVGTLSRNQNGTFVRGNFSTLVLKNQQNVEFIYDSVQFSFECPALHKSTKTKQQLIQLQISYRLRGWSQQSIKAPYEHIVYSFPFMISEYTPTKSKPLNEILELNSNKQVDLSQIVQNMNSNSSVLVYSARYESLSQKTILRLIRKEIRLISKTDWKFVKGLIEFNTGELRTSQQQNSQGSFKRPQKIYQIRSYPFQNSAAGKKQDL